MPYLFNGLKQETVFLGRLMLKEYFMSNLLKSIIY